MKLRTFVFLAFTFASLIPGTHAQHKPAPKPASGPAAPREQDQSPVGRWVARHGVNDELQYWWQFRPNGTFSVSSGPIARTTWKLDRTILTLGVGTKESPAGVFDTLFDGGHLYTKPHNLPKGSLPPVLQFTRINPAPSAAEPILGQWRMSDSPPSSDPGQEAIRQRLLHMIVSYKADGVYEVRIATEQAEGTWDAATRTYTLPGGTPLPYQRQGPGLNIASPKDPLDKRTYFADQMF